MVTAIGEQLEQERLELVVARSTCRRSTARFYRGPGDRGRPAAAGQQVFLTEQVRVAQLPRAPRPAGSQEPARAVPLVQGFG
jgi:hypothetical protein